MIKKKKILTIFIALVLIIFVAGFVLFKIIFSPGRVKNAIEKTASSAFQMEVTIERASLRPGLLLLHRVRISPENHQQKEETVFSAERVTLSFELFPLLRRKFIFRGVTAYKPDINLETLPAVNIKDILRHAGAGNSDNSMEFALRTVKINRGNLSLGKPEILLYELDFTLKETSLHRPFLLKAYSKIRNRHLESISLETEIDLLRNYADIKNITLSGYGVQAKGSGNVRDLANSPHADIDYRVKKFPSDVFADEVKVEGRPEIKGKLTYKADSVYLDLNSDFSESEIKINELIYKPAGRRLRLRGGASYTRESTSVNWYVLEAGPDTFSGTGHVEKSGAVKINIRGDNINLRNIGEFLLPAGKYVSAGYARLKADTVLSADRMSIEGTLNMRDLEIINAPGLTNLYERLRRRHITEFLFDSVQADIFLDPDKLILRSLSAEGAQLRGSGRGRLVWGEKVDFTFYPIIAGSRIGIRLRGQPGETRISLK